MHHKPHSPLSHPESSLEQTNIRPAVSTFETDSLRVMRAKRPAEPCSRCKVRNRTLAEYLLFPTRQDPWTIISLPSASITPSYAEMRRDVASVGLLCVNGDLSPVGMRFLIVQKYGPLIVEAFGRAEKDAEKVAFGYRWV